MAKKRELPRPSSPAAKRSDSKAIVEAIIIAGRALAAEGIDDLSVRALAKRAGVGEASVYRYFPDKGALFAELFRQQHEHIVDTIERAVSDAESLDDGIRRGVTAFAGFSEQEERLRRALNFDVPLRWSLQEFAVATDRIRDILVRWASRYLPEVPASELERRFFYIIAVVRGVVRLRLLQPQRAPTRANQLAMLTTLVTAIAHGQLPAGSP